MTNPLVSLLLLHVLANSSVGVAARPEPYSVLRVHVHLVDTLQSIDDIDVVIAYGAYGTLPNTRGSLHPSLLGSNNISQGGRVISGFYFQQFPLRDLVSFEKEIAALKPAEMPPACSLDKGPLQTGTAELTLYNGAAGAAQVIIITYENNPPETTKCPGSVESLVDSVDGFIKFEGGPFF